MKRQLSTNSTSPLDSMIWRRISRDGRGIALSRWPRREIIVAGDPLQGSLESNRLAGHDIEAYSLQARSFR